MTGPIAGCYRRCPQKTVQAHILTCNHMVLGNSPNKLFDGDRFTRIECIKDGLQAMIILVGIQSNPHSGKKTLLWSHGPIDLEDIRMSVKIRTDMLSIVAAFRLAAGL